MLTAPKMLFAPEGAGEGSNGGNKDSKDGNAVTQEALHAAIEKARLEERAKLRAEIEKAEKAKQDADSAQKETEKKLADTAKRLTDLTATVESIKGSKQADGSVDVAKLVSEVTEKVAKTYEETMGSKIMTLNTELSSLRLERLREKLIAEAGGPDKLVLALVSGDTEEALKKSVEAAKSAYSEIAARIEGKSKSQRKSDSKKEEEDDASAGDDGDENDSNNNGSNLPPDSVSGQAGGSGAGGSGAGKGKEASVIGQVRTMDMKAYASNRDKVMAQLKQKFPEGRNPMIG